MNGNEDDDEMRGGTGTDTMNGDADDDEMYGDDAADAMHGNAGNDYMRGGVGTDTMDGDADTDEMYGDNDVDVMRGGGADDLMRGGSGDDKIEGNGNSSQALPLDVPSNPLSPLNADLDLTEGAGNAWTASGGGDGDVIYGDADQDDIVGGSQGTPAAADGGDTILGNAAQDVIVGDDGDITRPGGADADGTTTRSVDLRNPGTDGGADYVQGNDENDDVYAGGAGDLVHGDLGDDYVEGNGGSDGDPAGDHLPVAAIGLYGDAGQDDLIGGTSQGTGGVADGADDIWGGQGADVATGDNADLTRASGSDCPAEPNGSAGYDCNTFRLDAADVVIRRIQLSDVATTGAAAPAGSSAGDTIGGQDGHDRLYGQGGDDWIEGGGNDDFAFGNADSDTIFGGDGQDDLIGGTGRTDSADQATATDGRLDAGDIILGEGDFDAIAGDNARMVRQTQDGDTGPNADSTGLWKANTFNSAVDRLIALMDVAVVGSPAGAGTSGNDQLLGGAADDTVYGQGGNDGISGGADQDLLEGNANGTGNAPDPAGTYGGSWPVFAGDVIHGDAGADDIAGGTGWIYRMVGGVETADPVAASVRIGADGRLDSGDTIFGDTGGDAAAGDNTVIERALTPAGAWILDDLHGPDALGVVRRVMRQRDVATVAAPAPLTNGTSGPDVIFGNDGSDLAYGQGGEDAIQGNAGDDHLEGSANDDTITGNEGRDDIVGGTGRTFSNDDSTAAAGRIDNPAGDDAANDILHGGNGLGAVAADDDDVIAADNATIDRVRGTLGSVGAELNRLPFNATWGEATWDEPNILRVVRLLDVATTANTAPEANGTNGDDTVNGEANEDALFGQGGNDTMKGDDADLDGSDPGDAGGDDYIEGNGGADMIHGNLGEDDIAGGGSATSGILDANRDGTLDPTRSGETLRDGNDLIAGDSGLGTAGDGDVIAGDNARIQRPLAAGDWRVDPQRKDLDAESGAQLRDVFLFDIELVGTGEPGDAATGESGVDTISGNGGEDILIGQGNGAVATAYGTESGIAGTADCQDVTGGPGTGAITGSEEAPNGDNDNDDLPDLNDPQCRVTAPGDTLLGETGEDYVEGNQGSDNAFGGEGEDDVVGGSSSNTGHLNVILPPADRDAGFAPGAITDANRPFNLVDGHDVIEGNAEDDIVAGDNAFVERYTGAAGAWVTLAGPGAGPFPATDRPNSEPARAAFTATDMVRRDVTTRAVKESAGAFGNDYVRGGGGKDDVYGLLGNDWLEGNEEEDAIVGDMGKIVDNQLGGPTPDAIPDPPLNQFIAPQQPFLGSTINVAGTLKREVTLYAFDESAAATVGIGHDVVLGGDANDSIHTGPGQDLVNGNAGDDRIWLGDNAEDKLSEVQNGLAQAHDQVDAGWGGGGYDHIWGGYGADYLDVRPRSQATTPGVVPTSDPETWFQIAGGEASHNAVVYGQESFEGIDYLYGGWDQDTMQANEGDNGPKPGDRLLDWAGVYNAYYLCPSTYGDWVSTRAIAPGLIEFLQTMSQGFGAVATATAGTSGFRETAIVFSNEQSKNANPIHPDTPAHFTCGPGTVTP
jgi:Ca2+-binding RTX toxin-like protein